MDKISLTILIEDGIVVINDSLGNSSSNDIDPDILISDQVGTYVADHIENNNIYGEILAEGNDNADYIDDEEFDELDD